MKIHQKQKDGWKFIEDGESVVDLHMALPLYPLSESKR